MPNGLALLDQPTALDRSAWWPVIASEGWDARVAMTLLERLEAALFEDMPVSPNEDDDE